MQGWFRKTEESVQSDNKIHSVHPGGADHVKSTFLAFTNKTGKVCEPHSSSIADVYVQD